MSTKSDAKPLAFETLVRPAILDLPAYTREAPPARPPARQIRLDWNESSHGPSPKARQAMIDQTAMHRYPEFDAHTLRTALAGYIGAAPEQMLAGAGLDDVLQTLAFTLLGPGDAVVISEPTFGVYRPLFAAHGAEVVDAPLTPDFQLDPERVLAAIDERTKFVVVCNPNNPTGNLFPAADVERIVAEAPCLVVIDEAYAEFAGVSHRPLMDRYPNVAVVRTMSKFAGLAGMRVGYGAFPPGLMPYLLRVMPAFCNISAPSTAAALASLDDLPYLETIVARIVADRDELAARLRDIPGVEPLPSATNFLLVRLPVADAGPIVRALAERGVFVRHFPRSRHGLNDCLRVSIGSAEENEIFLDELRDRLREQAA
ncbi:MAG TPA: histidinol-phosphate transaminase [Thermomicrobiales bacterium]|nr:histidinol-phosphate transaminase [Thermomicrobiales bacterium]